mmetsp:Transcript_55531/g.131063  ORF Transcript_55531/g.131063 Transcript_55531/m.131063 type:complete len:232 (-) Transcript_55531:182-877(-)
METDALHNVQRVRAWQRTTYCLEHVTFPPNAENVGYLVRPVYRVRSKRRGGEEVRRGASTRHTACHRPATPTLRPWGRRGWVLFLRRIDRRGMSQLSCVSSRRHRAWRPLPPARGSVAPDTNPTQVGSACRRDDRRRSNHGMWVRRGRGPTPLGETFPRPHSPRTRRYEGDRRYRHRHAPRHRPLSPPPQHASENVTPQTATATIQEHPEAQTWWSYAPPSVGASCRREKP